MKTGKVDERVPAVSQQDMETIIAALFPEKVVNRLAFTGKLPKNADRTVFVWWIKKATFWYLQELSAPNANTRHSEIKALRKSAKIQDFERLDTLLRSLSEESRLSLQGRCDARRETFPTHGDFSDADSARRACDLIVSITVLGGRVITGRKRPNGRHSKTWSEDLFAPKPERNFAKRSAERNFVRRMRAAWRWAAAGGDELRERALPESVPARTATHTNKGPFVRLLEETLKAIASVNRLALFVDVVETINGVNREDKSALGAACYTESSIKP
jgi:hypothetical protein